MDENRPDGDSWSSVSMSESSDSEPESNPLSQLNGGEPRSDSKLDGDYGPCHPKSRFHDLDCPMGNHRIQTLRPESCGANWYVNCVAIQDSAANSLAHDALTPLSMIFANFLSNLSTISESLAPFLCPRCLVSDLNIEIAKEDQITARRGYAVKKPAGTDEMRKMARDMIDQQISGGGRLCQEATKSSTAGEQLMEQFWSEVPDMLREFPRRADEVGMTQKRASKFAPYVPIVEWSRPGGKARPDRRYRTMSSRYVRRRSRSPELNDRHNGRGMRERNYSISHSPRVTQQAMTEVTERMRGARMGSQEADVFVTAVREYLGELVLKKIESDGKAASDEKGSADAKGQA